MQTINREACAWIAKLHDVKPTQAELNEFRAWMAQSPAHKEEVRQIARLWGELNVLTELAVTTEPEVELQAESQSWSGRLIRPGQLALGAACAAVVVLALVVLPMYSPEPSLPAQSTLPYTTAVGQQKLVTLTDGSSVMLNTDTHLEVTYSDTERRIYLTRGQAFFDVASSQQRPFKVFAGRGMVRAVGTAFSVYLKDSRSLEVTVTEGNIELNAVKQTAQKTGQVDFTPNAAVDVETLAIVQAGQNATFNQQAESLESIHTVDIQRIDRKLSWREGMLKFSGDPLQDVVNEVSRYTETKIVIQSPELRSLRIGGFFRIGETDKLFEALENSFDIRAKHINSKLVHLVAATANDDS